jgi:hypothetical protein
MGSLEQWLRSVVKGILISHLLGNHPLNFSPWVPLNTLFLDLARLVQELTLIFTKTHLLWIDSTKKDKAVDKC